MREKIETGAFYHIYNRGVDKRVIFQDRKDSQRFLESLREFNLPEPIGSLRDNKEHNSSGWTTGLVDVLAYCLNPNHFHLLIEQVADGGLSEFMKRLGGGYTRYFNTKHKRSGALFEGKYKYKLVDSEDYLKYISVYVNLNDKVHDYSGWTTVSSYAQYVSEKTHKDIYVIQRRDKILSLFEDMDDYKNYAVEVLQDIRRNKEKYRGIL